MVLADGVRAADGDVRSSRAGLALTRLPALRRPPGSAVRLLVRVLPALGGCPLRRGNQPLDLRHVRLLPRAARGRRGDGVRRRLPAPDPPDRRLLPQGSQQHPRSRTRRPRLALGDRRRRRAATTPSTPIWATSTRSTGSSPRPSRWGWRSPWTSRCRPRRTTPGSPTTRSGSPSAPTARSPTRRTRRRSTRTSTPSTSTTTGTGSTPSACASSSSGCATASGSSGSTTRTPSPSTSGPGSSARFAGPTRTCCSWPRRSPGRR